MDNEVSDLRKGTWIDPSGGRATLEEYSDVWMRGRGLAARTEELYRQQLDDWILPTFGDRPLSAITPAQVRAWHGELPGKIVAREAKRPHPRANIDGKTATAKAYRLLATIMRSAVADELIPRTPCKLTGASKEAAPERGTVSVEEVEALAQELPERHQIVPLLIFWCQLRQGEWMALRRGSLNLRRGTVEIRVSRTKRADGRLLEKTPKSAAGARRITIPPNALFPLREHCKRFVETSGTAYVVTGAAGGPLHPGTWYKAWEKATAAIGRPELRPHDLRHSGLTLLAQKGATTAELMFRAGHASPVAALRYQHATEERDRQLAYDLADADPNWHKVGTDGSGGPHRGGLRRVK